MASIVAEDDDRDEQLGALIYRCSVTAQRRAQAALAAQKAAAPRQQRHPRQPQPQQLQRQQPQQEPQRAVVPHCVEELPQAVPHADDRKRMTAAM